MVINSVPVYTVRQNARSFSQPGHPPDEPYEQSPDDANCHNYCIIPRFRQRPEPKVPTAGVLAPFRGIPPRKLPPQFSVAAGR